MRVFQSTFATGVLPAAAAEAFRASVAQATITRAKARFTANTTVFAPSTVVPAAPKVAGNDVGLTFRRAGAVAAPAVFGDSFQAIVKAVRACADVSEYDAAVAQAAVANGQATPAQIRLAEQSDLIRRNLGKAAIALAQLQAAPAKAVAKATPKVVPVMALPKAAPAAKAKVRAPIGFAAHVEAVKAAAVRKAAAKAAYVTKAKAKAKVVVTTAPVAELPKAAAANPTANADWSRIVASLAQFPRTGRNVSGNVYEITFANGDKETREVTFDKKEPSFVVSSTLKA